MLHLFKQGGVNVVIDVFSSSVHVVDDITYAVLERFETETKEEIIKALNSSLGVSKEEINEAFDEIEELKNAGQLFTQDTFEPLAKTLKERSKGIVKALCLHVAHSCNLNCSYCFASQGKYHGERALMSYEVGKRALDFLIENSGTRRNLEVDFFGGEPLLNFQLVKDLVAYARSVEKKAGKNFRFTLTTNGVLIDDDVIDFCNREMSNVVLSLDGRKEVHDRFRVDYAGNGSFDNIVPKFQKFIEKRGDKDYYMRGTFTHLNPDFLEDIKVMLDLGFDKVSIEPVVCADGEATKLTDQDLPVIYEQYEKLAELMFERYKQGKPFTFYHYMLDLEGGPCIYKRISGCGSGTEYMAVTPWGDLYPCHQFVGEEKFRLGSVFEGVTNLEMQAEFEKVNVYTHPECADCWAKMYCSGGCAANAYHATGSVNGIYEYGCKLFKKRIECAIAYKARIMLDQDENSDN